MIKEIIDLTNNNSGFISVLLFLFGIIIAWISGFFKLLRNNPEFRIDVLEQCSFYSVFDLNKKYEDLPVNKTAFVLYLRITNIGKASSSIGKIRLGYLKSDFSHRLFTKRIWIKETVAKEDFKYQFENSDSVKIYPFLKQKNQFFPNNNETFLQVGQQVNGIIYFEQVEAYGNYIPRMSKNIKYSNIKLEILDAFGNRHFKRFDLKKVEPEEAFRYNNYFGQTYFEYINANNR